MGCLKVEQSASLFLSFFEKISHEKKVWGENVFEMPKFWEIHIVINKSKVLLITSLKKTIYKYLQIIVENLRLV